MKVTKTQVTKEFLKGKDFRFLPPSPLTAGGRGDRTDVLVVV
jgi:hypothetical protein